MADSARDDERSGDSADSHPGTGDRCDPRSTPCHCRKTGSIARLPDSGRRVPVAALAGTCPDGRHRTDAREHATDRFAAGGAEPAGAGWNSSACITKTLTPKSLTQTFDALAGLADQLNGAGETGQQRTAVGAGVDALDRATAGTGDQINEIIAALSRALVAPDAAIGHIGQLLDALTELAHRARGGWSQVETTVSGLPQTFDDIVTIAFPPIIEIVAALADLLPQLNDVIVMFGSPALRALDSVPDLSRMIAVGVGSLADVIAMAPAVASGFAGAVDPASGALTIGYAPPKLVLAQQDTAQVCAAVQVVTGQPCQAIESGAMTIPALPLLLGAVSAR